MLQGKIWGKKLADGITMPCLTVCHNLLSYSAEIHNEDIMVT